MSDDQRPLIDGKELERWLAELSPSERAAVESALARDPDLRGEVRLLVSDLPTSLREEFLRRFGPAAARAGRPAVAVMEGLRGAAGAAVRRRRRSGRGPS